jgi:hypothetical protein
MCRRDESCERTSSTVNGQCHLKSAWCGNHTQPERFAKWLFGFCLAIPGEEEDCGMLDDQGNAILDLHYVAELDY